jgi:DNA-binding NtrC family response regulator
VLLDIWMPDTDGVTLLREWAASGQLTMPVIMMSGHGTIETAVEATKIGAFDFLEKPVGLQKLLGTVARALKIALAREPRRVSLASIGTSAAMRDVERQMEQLLAARKPVLILGEPGAGHDVAARALHALDTPRVALPSGARLASNPLAILEEARDGTLYLFRDRPVCESRAARACVSAAQARQGERHARLHEHGAARQHGRREQSSTRACWQALSTGAVLLPPLRARREDIPALIERFWHDVVAQERNAQHPTARELATLQPTALNMLASAYWPGNLDHLQSVIAILRCIAGSADVTTEHVKRLVGRGGSGESGGRPRDHARFLRASAPRRPRGVRAHLLRATARDASRAT